MLHNTLRVRAKYVSAYTVSMHSKMPGGAVDVNYISSSGAESRSCSLNLLRFIALEDIELEVLSVIQSMRRVLDNFSPTCITSSNTEFQGQIPASRIDARCEIVIGRCERELSIDTLKSLSNVCALFTVRSAPGDSNAKFDRRNRMNHSEAKMVREGLVLVRIFVMDILKNLQV